MLPLEGLLVENPRVFPNRTDLTIETTKIIDGTRIIPVACGGGVAKQAENSDVLPEGSVAVAETRTPGSVAIRIMMSKAPWPPPSVVT